MFLARCSGMRHFATVYSGVSTHPGQDGVRSDAVLSAGKMAGQARRGARRLRGGSASPSGRRPTTNVHDPAGQSRLRDAAVVAPHAGAIGHDFNRLGMAFWELVDTADKRNRRRRDLLDELNRWRNAIAHQDFDPAALGGRVTVTLEMIRSWRSACDMLAVSFDPEAVANLF